MKPKTMIYALVSVVVILAGVVIVLRYRNEAGAAIGASIVAGGLSSLAFCIIRYFDDKDEEERFAKLFGNIESLAQAIQSLRLHEVARRRIRFRRPREALAKAIEAVDRGRTIEIDAIGISLKPFYDDWMQHLRARGGVRVRLLVMDPRTAIFERFCADQGVDKENFTKDIIFTTSEALNLERLLIGMRAGQGGTADQSPLGRTGTSLGFEIKLRWDPGFQSVTLTRVNEILLARSRLVNEAKSPDVFFEVYRNNSSEHPYFEMYRKYFEEVWKRSSEPTEKELKEVTAGFEGCIKQG